MEQIRAVGVENAFRISSELLLGHGLASAPSMVPPRPGVEEELIQIPDIEIVALSPSDSGTHETWRAIWPDVDTSDAAACSHVAYKVFRNGKTIIYFNAEFPGYRVLLEKWKSKPHRR